MYKLIEQLAEKIASKYSLDKDALLSRNQDIMYLAIEKNSLLEIDRHTRLSKCISEDEHVIDLFESIQTLLNDDLY